MTALNLLSDINQVNMKQSQNYRQKLQNSGHIKNHPISFSTISASIVLYSLIHLKILTTKHIKAQLCL